MLNLTPIQVQNIVKKQSDIVEIIGKEGYAEYSEGGIKAFWKNHLPELNDIRLAE